MGDRESQWVTEKIGEEYKNWKDGIDKRTNKEQNEGDKIFISAPTGSGKTHFVLNVLPPYFYKQGKKILFIVNRRILKEQVEEEIYRVPFEMRNNIRIELYQSLENLFCSIQFGPIQQFNGTVRYGYAALGYKAMENFKAYDCVVCDECHYFLADSNYNTNTVVSYRIVNKLFQSKIRIFLSATIKQIQKYIEDNEKNVRNYRTPIYNIYSIVPGGLGGGKWLDGKTYQYSMYLDYEYLDIQILDNKDDIMSLVTQDSDKWLIFVDNINYGQALKNDLIKLFKDDEESNRTVVMLSSSFEKNEESANEVQEVVNTNSFKAKIIISTSVMDNGISIKDINLRNMIIISDNEVEFIQMLGRKRRDTKKLKLYIFKQKKEYFARRLKQVQRLLEIANEYFRDFERYIQKPLLEIGNKDLRYINSEENRMLMDKHIYIMHDIANGKIQYEEAKKLFLVYNGVLYLNRLSMKNLENLDSYYNRILKRFDEEGEDAFLREQLEWLGKTSEEIDDIIKNSKISLLNKYHADVVKKIEAKLNKKMKKKENADFKETIKKEVLYMLEQMEETYPGRNTYRDVFYKKGREISKPAMDFLREHWNLPYEIELTNERENEEISNWNEESQNEGKKNKSKKKDNMVTYYTIKRYSGKINVDTTK